MSSRAVVIGLVVIVVVGAIIFMSRPFQETVVEEEPGQAPPHAIDH